MHCYERNPIHFALFDPPKNGSFNDPPFYMPEKKLIMEPENGDIWNYPSWRYQWFGFHVGSCIGFFSEACLRSKRCGQENVASLNISMDLLPIMQVLQALQHLQGFTHLGHLAALNRDLEPSNLPNNPPFNSTRRSQHPQHSAFDCHQFHIISPLKW